MQDLGLSGSLSTKKDQDSVLYQIPILHHRQRAEEAQEAREGSQASKLRSRRGTGPKRNQPCSQREETETLKCRISWDQGRQDQGRLRGGTCSQQGPGETEAQPTEVAGTWTAPVHRSTCAHFGAPSCSPSLPTFTASGLESPLSTRNHITIPLLFLLFLRSTEHVFPPMMNMLQKTEIYSLGVKKKFFWYG